MLSITLICPSVRVSVLVFVCLLCEVPFKHLFVPTSQSWISKIVRDSEFLGKTNAKIWKLLLIKGVKSLRNFALLSRIFLVLVFLTLCLGLFSPTSQIPMSKLFRFSESLGEIYGKKWSQSWQLFLIKGVKSPLHLNVFLPLFPKVQCQFFFPFRNPLGKTKKRSGLRFRNFCS